MKVLEWFAENNPFDTSDSRLRNIATGMVASGEDEVNCDLAEEVGYNVMTGMDNSPYSAVVLRKADHVKTLACLDTRIKVNNKHIVVDSYIPFDRLLVIIEKFSNIEMNFCYELSSMPMSLFKDGCLRKAAKSVLARELMKGLDVCAGNLSSDLFVIDGGCLLHRVKWSQAYADVVQQFVNYVRKHCGCNCIIVFDCHCNGPSIKDHEHQKRAVKSCPDITVEEFKPVLRS
jgi:hypothetical protein